MFSQSSALNSSDVDRPMEQMKISQISTDSTKSAPTDQTLLNYQRTMSTFSNSHAGSQPLTTKASSPGSTLRTSAFQ